MIAVIIAERFRDTNDVILNKLSNITSSTDYQASQLRER